MQYLVIPVSNEKRHVLLWYVIN